TGEAKTVAHASGSSNPLLRVLPVLALDVAVAPAASLSPSREWRGHFVRHGRGRSRHHWRTGAAPPFEQGGTGLDHSGAREGKRDEAAPVTRHASDGWRNHDRVPAQDERPRVGGAVAIADRFLTASAESRFGLVVREEQVPAARARVEDPPP